MTRLRDRFRSLTSRLVVTTVLLVLMVSVLVATATTLGVRSYLNDQLDHDVSSSMRRLQRPEPTPDAAPQRIDLRGQGPGTLIALIGEDDEQGLIIPASNACLLYTSPSPRDLSTSPTCARRSTPGTSR